MRPFPASKRALGIEYAIRDVVLPARELEKKGIKVLKFNIGDPCAYDFDTPHHMKEALREAAEKGFNGYTESEGVMELRQAICEREKRKNNLALTVSDICVTTGVTESIQMVFASMLSPGDEVLIPGPSYPPYASLATFLGGNPVEYPTDEEKEWAPDVLAMAKKITKKTRAICIINPNNPTGALYPRKTLEEITNLAAQHKLIVISDEIYDMMTYDETQFSPSFAKDVPMILFNGISKIYLSPGWRIGWIMIRDVDERLSQIKEGILRQARLRLSANSICQRAAVAALNGPQDHIPVTMKRLRERRDFAYKRFNEIEGLSSRKPQGAFYIFPKIESKKWKTDKDFVLDVLNEAHVLFVHGSGFSRKYGKMHFRSVILPSLPIMEGAFGALETFMKKRTA